MGQDLAIQKVKGAHRAYTETLASKSYDAFTLIGASRNLRQSFLLLLLSRL